MEQKKEKEKGKGKERENENDRILKNRLTRRRGVKLFRTTGRCGRRCGAICEREMNMWLVVRKRNTGVLCISI